MSVIVKGMTINKKDAQSCICTINMLRNLAYNTTGVLDWIDHENCDKIIKMLETLIELPPHGRLIAEKTITEFRYHDADGYHIVNGEQLCELEIDAEVIIEAEGETE